MICRERGIRMSFPKTRCKAKKVNKIEEKMAKSLRDAFSRMRIQIFNQIRETTLVYRQVHDKTSVIFKCLK